MSVLDWLSDAWDKVKQNVSNAMSQTYDTSDVDWGGGTGNAPTQERQTVNPIQETYDTAQYDYGGYTSPTPQPTYTPTYNDYVDAYGGGSSSGGSSAPSYSGPSAEEIAYQNQINEIQRQQEAQASARQAQQQAIYNQLQQADAQRQAQSQAAMQKAMDQIRMQQTNLANNIKTYFSKENWLGDSRAMDEGFDAKDVGATLGSGALGNLVNHIYGIANGMEVADANRENSRFLQAFNDPAPNGVINPESYGAVRLTGDMLKNSQMTNSMLQAQQNLRDYSALTGSKAGELGESIGNQAFNPILGALGGEPLTLADMYLSTFGSASEQALQNGADINQAALYGALSGAKEVGTEKFSPGIPGVNMEVGLGSLLGEGMEEAIGTYLDPFVDIALQDNSSFDKFLGNLGAAARSDLTLNRLGEAADAFAMGAASAGVMGGAGNVVNAVAHPVYTAEGIADTLTGSNRYANDVKEVNDKISMYEDIAKTSTGMAKQTAEQMAQDERDRKRTYQRIYATAENLRNGDGQTKKAAQAANAELIRDTAKEAGAKLSDSQITNIAKIANKAGVAVEFTKDGIDFNGAKVDGLQTDDGRILINANASDPIATIFAHEITHATQGTNEYKSLRNTLTSMANAGQVSTEGVDAIRNSDLTNEQKQNEITAVLAQNILGNDTSINHLANRDMNLLRYMYERITNYSDAKESAVIKAERAMQKAIKNAEVTNLKDSNAYKNGQYPLAEAVGAAFNFTDLEGGEKRVAGAEFMTNQLLATDGSEDAIKSVLKQYGSPILKYSDNNELGNIVSMIQDAKARGVSSVKYENGAFTESTEAVAPVEAPKTKTKKAKATEKKAEEKPAEKAAQPKPKQKPEYHAVNQNKSYTQTVEDIAEVFEYDAENSTKDKNEIIKTVNDLLSYEESDYELDELLEKLKRKMKKSDAYKNDDISDERIDQIIETTERYIKDAKKRGATGLELDSNGNIIENAPTRSQNSDGETAREAISPRGQSPRTIVSSVVNHLFGGSGKAVLKNIENHWDDPEYRQIILDTMQDHNKSFSKIRTQFSKMVEAMLLQDDVRQRYQNGEFEGGKEIDFTKMTSEQIEDTLNKAVSETTEGLSEKELKEIEKQAKADIGEEKEEKTKKRKKPEKYHGDDILHIFSDEYNDAYNDVPITAEDLASFEEILMRGRGYDSSEAAKEIYDDIDNLRRNGEPAAFGKKQRGAKIPSMDEQRIEYYKQLSKEILETDKLTNIGKFDTVENARNSYYNAIQKVFENDGVVEAGDLSDIEPIFGDVSPGVSPEILRSVQNRFMDENGSLILDATKNTNLDNLPQTAEQELDMDRIARDYYENGRVREPSEYRTEQPTQQEEVKEEKPKEKKPKKPRKPKEKATPKADQQVYEEIVEKKEETPTVTPEETKTEQQLFDQTVNGEQTVETPKQETPVETPQQETPVEEPAPEDYIEPLQINDRVTDGTDFADIVDVTEDGDFVIRYDNGRTETIADDGQWVKADANAENNSAPTEQKTYTSDRFTVDEPVTVDGKNGRIAHIYSNGAVLVKFDKLGSTDVIVQPEDFGKTFDGITEETTTEDTAQAEEPAKETPVQTTEETTSEQKPSLDHTNFEEKKVYYNKKGDAVRFFRGKNGNVWQELKPKKGGWGEEPIRVSDGEIDSTLSEYNRDEAPKGKGKGKNNKAINVDKKGNVNIDKEAAANLTEQATSDDPKERQAAADDLADNLKAAMPDTPSSEAASKELAKSATEAMFKDKTFNQKFYEEHKEELDKRFAEQAKKAQQQAEAEEDYDFDEGINTEINRGNDPENAKKLKSKIKADAKKGGTRGQHVVKHTNWVFDNVSDWYETMGHDLAEEYLLQKPTSGNTELDQLDNARAQHWMTENRNEKLKFMKENGITAEKGNYYKDGQKLDLRTGIGKQLNEYNLRNQKMMEKADAFRGRPAQAMRFDQMYMNDPTVPNTNKRAVLNAQIEVENERIKRLWPKKVAKGDIKLIDEITDAEWDAYEQAEGDAQKAELEKIYKRIGEAIPATMSERVRAWRYMMMLANPMTHVRNFVGNGAMQAITDYKDAVAVLVEAGVKRTKAGKDMLAQYTKESGGLARATGSKELTKFAHDQFNEMKEGGEDISKWGTKQGIDAYRRYLGIFDGISRVNAKLLDGSDDWFTSSRFSKEFKRLVNANGYTFADGQLTKNGQAISQEKLNELRNTALTEAKQTTFHDISHAAKLIQEFEDLHPAAGFFTGAIMPFKSTPINMGKRMIEYSPVGLAKSIVKGTSDFHKGNISANEFVNGIAKGLSGTSLFAIGTLLSSMGLLRAGGDPDDDWAEKRYKEDVGLHQDYSFVMPVDGVTLKKLKEKGMSDEEIKMFISVEALNPAITPMLLGARWHEVMGTEGLWDEDADLVTNFRRLGINSLDILGSMAQPLMDMSMMQGIQSLFEDVSYALNSSPDGETDYSNVAGAVMGSLAETFISQFLPSAGGAINRTLDPVTRTTYDPMADTAFLRQLVKKVPFAHQIKSAVTGNDDYWLQPLINARGEEVTSEGNTVGERFINNFANPFSYKTNKSTEADRKLLELYNETGGDGLIPYNFKSAKLDGTKYTFTPEGRTQVNKDALGDYQKEIKAMIDSGAWDANDPEYLTNLLDKVKYHGTKNAEAEYFNDIGLPGDNLITSQDETVNFLDKKGVHAYQSYDVLSVQNDLNEDGDTIKNSAALRKLLDYDKLGVLEDIRKDIAAHKEDSQYAFNRYGLNKSVLGWSNERINYEWSLLQSQTATGRRSSLAPEKKAEDEPTPTGKTADLGGGTGTGKKKNTGTTSKKSSGTGKKSSGGSSRRSSGGSSRSSTTKTTALTSTKTPSSITAADKQAKEDANLYEKALKGALKGSTKTTTSQIKSSLKSAMKSDQDLYDELVANHKKMLKQLDLWGM